jgi:hypothetical protein
MLLNNLPYKSRFRISELGDRGPELIRTDDRIYIGEYLPELKEFKFNLQTAIDDMGTHYVIDNNTEVTPLQ